MVGIDQWRTIKARSNYGKERYKKMIDEGTKILAQPVEKICLQCGNPFTTTVSNKLTCSKECANAYTGVKRYGDIDSGKTGAVSELQVSCDLLSKGYEIYRSLSQSSSADLMCQKIGGINRFSIEVKTANRSLAKEDKFSCDLSRFRADILAAVLPNEIVYIKAKGVHRILDSNRTNFEKDDLVKYDDLAFRENAF